MTAGGGGGGEGEELACTINVIKPSIRLDFISFTGSDEEEGYSPWQEITLQNAETYQNVYSFVLDTNASYVCEMEKNKVIIQGNSQGINRVRCKYTEENFEATLNILCRGSSRTIPIAVMTDFLTMLWKRPIYLIVGVIILIILLGGLYSIAVLLRQS